MPTHPHHPTLHSSSSRAPRQAGPARRGRHALTALVMTASVTIGVSACGQGSTTGAGSTSIAASDLGRIASANGSSSSSSTPAGSGETSSTPQQFAVPAAAKAHTQEGAKAFVQFYWTMLGQLDARPQTGVIPKYSLTDCASCRMQEQKAKELALSGAHVEAVGTRLVNFQVNKESLHDSVIVTFDHSNSARTRVNKDGSTHPLSRVNSHVAARADWVNGEWKLGMSGADAL